jgi:hypothetical protein
MSGLDGPGIAVSGAFPKGLMTSQRFRSVAYRAKRLTITSSVVLASLLLISAGDVSAQIANPARDISEVSKDAIPEAARQLRDARVVLADYDLIKKDFPELRSWSNPEIDRWLLNRTAYVSIPQLSSRETNTEIMTSGRQILAFRPPNYNRALVFTAGGGLIDSKGNGSLQPYLNGHGNGLATLGEMIREYLYQKLVQKIFDHSHSNLRTVGNYAVLDFGFRVIHVDGSTSPAGAILRQAHARSPGYMSTLPANMALRIEAIMRKYGVTTTGSKRDLDYDIINAQGTVAGDAIDFGGFLVYKKMIKPSALFLPNGAESDAVYFVPGSDTDIQADPNFKIPYELWGSSVTQDDDSKTDNPFVWSHELAESLARGTAQRADAEQHLRNLLEPIDRLFAANPRPWPRTCQNIFR